MRPTEDCRTSVLQIYQAQFSGLLAMLRRLLGDPSQAQDLVQQLGVKLMELDARQVQQIRDPRAFLYQVAGNMARDVLRRRMTAQAGHAELERQHPQAAPPPDVLLDHQQTLSRVQRAIAELPEQARRVLLLARIEGHSHKEIAARLGIQPKTVENHLARAMALLAARLGTA